VDVAMPHRASIWTIRRFFEELRAVSPLRVISISGPSVFETICAVDGFGIADGHLNAITSTYHWHLRVDACRRLRSGDQIHERSGRRVLFFELYGEGDRPFISIYLHREKGTEFEPDRLARFERLHRELADGVALESGAAA
jgi:putative heme iron utilization protein